MPEFKFNLGDEVMDRITGFRGIITCRSQWISNCNTYGVMSRDLKDGVPMERQYFDEPNLGLVKAKKIEPNQETGGPERPVYPTNRM